MDTQHSAHTNRLHRVKSSQQCTTCVSYVSVTWVYGVIFILCFSCAAAVLECSCATGCDFNNVCDQPQSCGRRNMALGRPATISSLFNSSQWNQVSGPACVAVNGNTGNTFRPINLFPVSPNCVHTAENNNPSYWEVDLGRPYDIHTITVYARENSENQLVTAIVKVDNRTCFTITTKDEFPDHLKADITCSPSQRGQRIQIYKETGLLMFCEVQVWVACGSSKPCAYCGHCKANTDCDHTSRNCTQGCDAGWTGIECDQRACTNGSYGLNCSKVCGNCSEGTTCDTVSGECPSGCKPGYQGSHCDVSCSPGTYGADCKKTCGNCTGNSPCNIYDGRCETGCAAGYILPSCKEACTKGSYGLNCSNTCGNCSEGTTCDTVSGECPSGCKPGYQGSHCDVSCSPGTYGADCNKTCGNCTGNSPCNIYDGRCETGCAAGYLLPSCKEVCSNGSYGVNCANTCGNCTNDTTCDFASGECPKGCSPGYQGIYCNETCKGTYGANCSQTCGRCSGGSDCNIFTGHCETGCVVGYFPPFCSSGCSYSYGINCSNTCGNCSGGTPCLPDTGMCVHGCIAGYQLPYCNQTCTSNTYGINCSSTCGNCDNSTGCDLYSGACQACALNFSLPYCKDCINGYYGTDCQETCGHCKNNVSCTTNTGLCPEGCEGSWQGDNCKQDAIAGTKDKTPVIAGVTVACIVVLIIAILVVAVVLLRRRQRSSKQQTSQQDTTSLSPIPLSSKTSGPGTKPNNEKPSVAVRPTVVKMSSSDGEEVNSIKLEKPPAVSSKAPKKNHGNTADILHDLEDECDHTYRNDESVYATFKASRPQLDNVQQTLIDLLASGHLTDRFQELPKGLTDEHEAAKLPVNIKKNRYYSVLPYDKNRVILTDGFSDGKATDYINASYISGCYQQKTYIATQGPRDNTVGDFWRMVWQEQITQIIMLTSLIENGKTKCYEYWPERDTTQTYGPVTVRCVDVQRRANFFIRTFIIQMHASMEEREVEQLNFVAWPDHGVPTTTSLLNFWRFAKSRAPQPPPPPVLVHCTAGVGRTGAYIGLDIAYEVAVSGGDVHVNDIVKRMREERCIMVQAAEQFVFLHKAVLEAYTGRDTVIPSDRFHDIFPQTVRARREHPRIDREFKKVIQMRSLAPDMSVKVATEARNKTKIRNATYLPADDHLVYLTAHVPGRNQFINAVYVSTYREYKGSILTQLPLEETLVDFWRLVDGCDANTIVSLGGVKEAEADYCQFWPKDAGTSLTVDPYVIRHKSTFPLGSHLISYTLSLEKKKEPGCRQVQLLHYTAWAGELPDDMTDLLGLMDKVDALCLQDNNPAPVIIQCHDGVTRSGMFSTLWNVLSRLTSDKDIDVYMAVRETHSVTPHAVTSLEQYRYCYEVAQKRISDRNIYTNADTSTDMNIYSNI